MDIKEGCRQGNLCYGKDDDGIPIKPNQICIDHDTCSPPGASLSQVLPDFIEYWKDKMNTEMGNGVDFMMGTHKWHGVAPNDEQLEKALNQNPETIKDY